MMRNNSIHKVNGTGTIRLRIFEGIVRELRDVMYIPKLKRYVTQWVY